MIITMPAQTLCDLSCCWLIFMIFVLRTLLFWIAFSLLFSTVSLLFPFFFPLLNTCTHSGCWDNFILMTICLTIFTSCIVAFYFGVEVLGQLNLLSTPIILLILHRSSSVAVSGPGSARLWMLFVAVNECVCINPSSFLFLFLISFYYFLLTITLFSFSLSSLPHHPTHSQSSGLPGSKQWKIGMAVSMPESLTW